MAIKHIIVLFVETPRKFITGKLSIRKPGSSSVLIYLFIYLNIFIHGSLSVACFSKGRGLKLLKRYKTKSKPKV
jgi:hypothetical protein